MTDPTAFGHWLTSKRLELGKQERRTVSMAEVARRAEISRQYLSFLEAGHNPSTGKPSIPDKQVVIRLAEALKADPEEALDAAGYGESDPRIAPLARLIRRIRDEDMDTVQAILERFADRREGSGRVIDGAYGECVEYQYA